jgi:hypothetical protein
MAELNPMLLVTDLPIIKNHRPRAMFICAIHTSSPSARLKLARMSRLDRAFVESSHDCWLTVVLPARSAKRVCCSVKAAEQLSAREVSPACRGWRGPVDSDHQVILVDAV